MPQWAAGGFSRLLCFFTTGGFFIETRSFGACDFASTTEANANETPINTASKRSIARRSAKCADSLMAVSQLLDFLENTGEPGADDDLAFLARG